MRGRVVAVAVALAAALGAFVVVGRSRPDEARSKPGEAPSANAEGTAPSSARMPPVDPTGPTAAAHAREGAPARARPGQEPEDEVPASDALVVVRDAIAKRTPESTATLLRALDGDDEVAKIEAIDELVVRKNPPALRKLLTFDPGGDPTVAPTAILALGKLARHGEHDAREATVARLAKILEEEKARQGTDSPGNILTAFEALGEIRSPSAAQVLERELLAPEHPTAARVAIVDALEVCGQRSSVTALSAFRAAFQPTATEPFEQSIERDLLTAVDRAIATLSRAP